jgi:hypothetical protein
MIIMTTANPTQGYLTARGHYAEAARLLWVIEDMLEDDDVPRSAGELAVTALAHAVTALAADSFGDRNEPAASPEPGPVLRRDQVLFWLSGPGVPSEGWSARKIANQTGATLQRIRLVLEKMEAEGLVLRHQRDKLITWSLP